MKNFSAVNVKMLCLAAFAAALTAGCRSYEASPVDWEAEARLGVTNVIHISSVEDAAELALVGNRELNAMRLKAGGSAKVAKETGWWEDPELDFDLMRIVNPSDNPFLGGGSIAFTIPLSGALALDEKAAEAYAEATSVRLNRMSRQRRGRPQSGSLRCVVAARCSSTGAGMNGRNVHAGMWSVCMMPER